MYFLYKMGVFGQGVYWIGKDLKEGKSEADKAATLDRDDYHDWELYKFVAPDGYTTVAELNELVYTGVRDETVVGE